MSLPITIPYTFANSTSSIPLANLDTDLSLLLTTINGIGNGSVALSNVLITGGTLVNVAVGNISSNSVSFTANSTNAVTRTSQSKMADIVHVADFGAVADGVTDNTTFVQNAINFLQNTVVGNSYGGGTLVFGPGKYLFTGTLTISKSFINLKGDGRQSTFLAFQNGLSACITLDGTINPTQQLRNCSISDMEIVGVSKTGGANLYLVGISYCLFQNLQIEQCIVGIDMQSVKSSGNYVNCNDNTFRDLIIVPNLPASATGIYLHTPGSDTDVNIRMDVVTFENVVVEGQASSGGGTNVTCLFVDGYVNTIVGTSLRLHNAKYGLFVSNGLSSASSCPQFMNLFDVEAEQFSANALVINAGLYFKFVGCDFNNLSGSLGTSDTQAVVISPNTGKILTQSMQFDACRFGNCQQNGMYINAIDITLTNCSFSDTSKAGTGTFPAIDIDSLSSSVILTNIICQEYSTSYYPSNGVYINSGANNIIIDNLDATLCRDVAVYNNGATNVSVGQVTQPTGYTNGGTGGFVIKLANGGYYDFVYQSGVYCVTETQSTGCTAILMAGAGQTAVVSQIGGNFSNSSGSGNFRFFLSSTNHYRIQNNSGSAATFSIQSMQLRNSS